jgi:hypothetical protein
MGGHPPMPLYGLGPIADFSQIGISRAPGRRVLAGPHSPWSPPFAPPTPQRIAPPCSPASQLLWQGRTSRARASSTTVPHLPTASREGKRRDVPPTEAPARETRRPRRARLSVGRRDTAPSRRASTRDPHYATPVSVLTALPRSVCARNEPRCACIFNVFAYPESISFRAPF